MILLFRDIGIHLYRKNGFHTCLRAFSAMALPTFVAISVLVPFSTSLSLDEAAAMVFPLHRQSTAHKFLYCF
jgi:hypothetical protein